MPPTPQPEDDLDAIAPPQPVFHVEQALLGALLLEPHRLGDVTGIAADSFSTAAHAALYAAISALPPPDPTAHAQNTAWLDRVLATAREQARGLTASYLHTLIQVCPWPRHAPSYARMVEAEHARHRVQKAAEHLIQTAQDTSLPDPVPSVLAEADALGAVVDDIANRFPPRAGVLPRTAVPPPVPRGDGEAVEEEQLLLATATAHPASIESVRWLLPDDLTLPLHSGLWQCLTALDRRHEAIDPVTVLWEAQQRGLLDDGSDPRDVIRLLAEPAGSLDYWGERTLQRSLLATVEQVGRRIEAYAGNPAFQLVVGARRSLADIAAIRTRWQQATGPVPTARPRPTPPARAGPPTTTAAIARTARAPRATR
ncbi:DnaB-like helicase N-terminal domain-containing protein [Streptomyces sp. NPDC001828]|uniref:DnaB-like helicase N-terminal domain-containing protein n=1 Tax=Streptomyces sp. NPDC001828 TaxID=3364615 RepID=UPI0036AE8022